MLTQSTRIPQAPRCHSTLGPAAGGFKKSWTNSSILQSRTISKGSMRHEQGSLCQASIPCRSAGGQARLGRNGGNHGAALVMAGCLHNSEGAQSQTQGDNPLHPGQSCLAGLTEASLRRSCACPAPASKRMRTTMKPSSNSFPLPPQQPGEMDAPQPRRRACPPAPCFAKWTPCAASGAEGPVRSKQSGEQAQVHGSAAEMLGTTQELCAIQLASPLQPPPRTLRSQL